MLSTETGKVLVSAATQTMWTRAFDPDKSTLYPHHIKNPASASCLAWDINFIDSTVVKAKIEQRSQSPDGELAEPSTDGWDEKLANLTLDDFLDRNPDKQRLAFDPQLPDRLATLDVENVFPKLGVLPLPVPKLLSNTHDMDDAFSSQASLDAIFHSNPNEDLNTVSTLIVGRIDGTVTPIIYDAMNIGDLRLPNVKGAVGYEAMHMASHPFTCTYLLLVKASSYGGNKEEPGLRTVGSDRSLSDAAFSTKLALVPLSLNAIRSAGTAMHLIASKTIQLQNLFYYIEKVGALCVRLFQDTRAYISNRMSILDRVSQEEDHLSSLNVLYQLAATGHCGTAVLEDWLLETIGERVNAQATKLCL